ncbi:MAG: transcription antitermination factor NusB [Pseudomonadota bacterium]
MSSTELFAQRSAARMAAVQALYQMEMSGATSADITADFQAGRLPRDELGAPDAAPDPELFNVLMENAVARQLTIDRAIARRLATGWRLERIDSVARAILRAGATELEQRKDIPTPVVIDEYVEIAKAFFNGPEPSFINATLDACARDFREAEDVGGRI